MLFIAQRVPHEKMEKPCLRLDSNGTILIDNPADSMYYINRHRKQIIACIRKAALVAGMNYSSHDPLILNLVCKHLVFGSLIKSQIIEKYEQRSVRVKVDVKGDSHTVILNQALNSAHLMLN